MSDFINEFECVMCGAPLDRPGKFCSCRCSHEYSYQNRTCEDCGGEFWDGGTSCICLHEGESKPREQRDPLKRRFPDYYENDEYYEAGAIISSGRYSRAKHGDKQYKRNLIKKIASGILPSKGLPF